MLHAPLPPSAQRVADAAAALGLAIDIVAFAQSTRTAEDAAAAIGCQVGQIVKSLVFTVGGAPVMALVSGQNQLDTRKLAALFGVGRKQVARALEARLFESGKIVYFLAIGSVLYGVDADLQGQDRTLTHQEHIRRLAEVAHILLEAGVILIVTAIALTQADLEIIKAAVDPGRIETIWIGEEVTTDLTYDMHLPGGDEAEASALQIKRRLQDRGAIFSP